MNKEQFKQELSYLKIKANNVRNINGMSDIFLIELENNRKSLNYVIPENFDGKIKIFPDKKYRQAVILVEEKKRIVSECIERVEESVIERYETEKKYIEEFFSYKTLNYYIDEYDLDIIDPIISRFNIDPKLVPVSFEINHEEFSDYYDIYLKAEIPKTSLCFLVGYDEDHLFISMLPKNVQTVENAHKVLKPKGLNPGWKRQGEFFFSPLTKKELKEFTQKHGNKIHNVHYGVTEEDYLCKLNSNNGLEESDHLASNCYKGYNDIEYVYGYVTNDRHKPIFLENWHRVYYNNEIPSNGELFD